MLRVRYISSILFTCLFIYASSQTFERTFTGLWAQTVWKYEFKKEGYVKFSTAGHFGFVNETYRYSVTADTVFIYEGKLRDTAVSKFLLWKDSSIVSLETYYEYLEHTGDTLYTSKRRYDLMPKPDPNTEIFVTQHQFDSLVTESKKVLLQMDYATHVSDEAHRQIIRLYNTINITWPFTDKGLYADFLKTMEEAKYHNRMIDAYDWQPSWGMGIYFPWLQIQLGGGPISQSRYFIE